MTSIAQPPSARWKWVFLLAGSVSLAAQQWFTLWLIARMASAAEVGAYGLAQAWVLPVFALAGLQLRSLMATEPEMVRMGRVFLRLRAATIAFGLGYAAVLLVMEPSGAGSGALVAALGAARVVEMGSDFTDGLRHRAREYFGICLSQICRAMASFTGFVLVWLSTWNLTAALLAGCLAALMSAVLLDLPKLRSFRALPGQRDARSGLGLPLRSAIRTEGAWAEYRNILSHALPLALVQFLNLGILYVPRMVLSEHQSLDAVASYTCLATMVGAASLAAGAYAASLAPDFAAAESGGRSKLLVSAVRQVALGAIPVTAALAWFGPEILSMIFGKGIEFPRTAVAWVAVFALLWSVAAVFGTRATAERRTGMQVVAFGAALLVGAIACVLLAEPFGVAGATFSLVLSAIALLAVYGLGQEFLPARRATRCQSPTAVCLHVSSDCRSSLP